jgi:hypothetical protein
LKTITTALGGRRRVVMIILVALFYTALSLAYSFIGFLYYQPGSHYHEYSFGKLAVEIGGHYLFGFVAAAFLADLGIALLTGALAVLIDADHILSALNFNVSGRPDHSILYLFVSSAFIVYFGTRVRLSGSFIAKLVFVGPITLLAHLSYDILASSNGTTFQLLIPFNYNEYFFANGAWWYFEAGAILVSILGLYASRRISLRSPAPRTESGEAQFGVPEEEARKRDR